VLGMVQTEDLKRRPTVGSEGPDPSASVRVSGLEVAGQLAPEDDAHPEEVIEEDPARRAQRPIVATGGITLVCEGEFESLEIRGVEEGPEGRRDSAVAAKDVEVRRPHPSKLSLPRESVAGSAGDALARLLAVPLPPRRHRTPLREICSLEWLLRGNYTAQGFVGPGQITRENNESFSTVRCNVVERDIGTSVAEAQAAIERRVTLPPGYRVT